MQVSIARPSGTEIKNCKLFVANLPLNYSQPEVMGLFNQFGRIIECRVLMDASTGLSRCKAFVQFDTRTEAAKALALNSMTLDGGKRPLVVKFAENHSKRTGQMPVAGPGGMGVNGPLDAFPDGRRRRWPWRSADLAANCCGGGGGGGMGGGGGGMSGGGGGMGGGGGGGMGMSGMGMNGGGMMNSGMSMGGMGAGMNNGMSNGEWQHERQHGRERHERHERHERRHERCARPLRAHRPCDNSALFLSVGMRGNMAGGMMNGGNGWSAA